MLYFKKNSNRKLGEVVGSFSSEVYDERHFNKDEINEVLVLLGVCKYQLINEVLADSE